MAHTNWVRLLAAISPSPVWVQGRTRMAASCPKCHQTAVRHREHTAPRTPPRSSADVSGEHSGYSKSHSAIIRRCEHLFRSADDPLVDRIDPLSRLARFRCLCLLSPPATIGSRDRAAKIGRTWSEYNSQRWLEVVGGAGAAWRLPRRAQARRRPALQINCCDYGLDVRARAMIAGGRTRMSDGGGGVAVVLVSVTVVPVAVDVVVGPGPVAVVAVVVGTVVTVVVGAVLVTTGPVALVAGVVVGGLGGGLKAPGP